MAIQAGSSREGDNTASFRKVSRDAEDCISRFKIVKKCVFSFFFISNLYFLQVPGVNNLANLIGAAP